MSDDDLLLQVIEVWPSLTEGAPENDLGNPSAETSPVSESRHAKDRPARGQSIPYEPDPMPLVRCIADRAGSKGTMSSMNAGSFLFDV